MFTDKRKTLHEKWKSFISLCINYRTWTHVHNQNGTRIFWFRFVIFVHSIKRWVTENTLALRTRLVPCFVMPNFTPISSLRFQCKVYTNVPQVNQFIDESKRISIWRNLFFFSIIFLEYNFALLISKGRAVSDQYYIACT